MISLCDIWHTADDLHSAIDDAIASSPKKPAKLIEAESLMLAEATALDVTCGMQVYQDPRQMMKEEKLVKSSHPLQTAAVSLKARENHYPRSGPPSKPGSLPKRGPRP